MDISVLQMVGPGQLRAVLPSFLAQNLMDDTRRAQNLPKITELVNSWAETDVQGLIDHLRALGEINQVYTANPLTRVLSRAWCQDVITDVKVTGLDTVRAAAEQGPVVLLCNHHAYFDATATDAALAWAGGADVADKLVYLAGPKVYQDLFRRFAASCLHTLPVPQSSRLAHTERLSARELARQAIASLKAGREALAEGKILIFYPEGSRSRSGRMGGFLKGTHRFVQMGATVVPMALIGTRELQPVGSDALHPGPVHIHFGDPIAVPERGGSQVLEQAWHQISALLPAHMRPEPGAEALV